MQTGGPFNPDSETAQRISSSIFNDPDLLDPHVLGYGCFGVNFPFQTARSYREPPTTNCQTSTSIDTVISLLTARTIGIMLPLTDHHLRVLLVGSVPNDPCNREHTAKDERLIFNDSVSNGPRDREYVITR